MYVAAGSEVGRREIPPTMIIAKSLCRDGLVIYDATNDCLENQCLPSSQPITSSHHHQ